MLIGSLLLLLETVISVLFTERYPALVDIVEKEDLWL